MTQDELQAYRDMQSLNSARIDALEGKRGRAGLTAEEQDEWVARAKGNERLQQRINEHFAGQ